MSLIGLTEQEARTRLLTEGSNSLPSEKEQSLFQVIFSVLKEPMLLLLLGAGVISFLLAELVDALLLMATVVIVIGISIIPRAKNRKSAPRPT